MKPLPHDTLDVTIATVAENCTPAISDALTTQGHKLQSVGDFSNATGGGQAVIHYSASGVNYGACDPRSDGAALPETHPYFE